MLTYRHILLTTDLSEATDRVADHAMAIAKNAKAKLSIVHVSEYTPVVYGGGEFSIPLDINVDESLKDHAKQALAQLGNRLGIAEKNQYIASGSIKKAVVDLAEEIGADLIVVGTHSRHGIEHLLGATANAILHTAKCDVLTVRTTE